MGTAGISSLICGKIFDKSGLTVFLYVTFFSTFFTPLVFLDGIYAAILGTILWGVVLGSQESILRAAVANLIRKDKRATG